MKLQCEDYGQATVITVGGELNADHVDTFRKAALDRIEKHQIRDFVLDIENMEFIDSQGLETLLWLQDLCAENLGQVRLAGPQDNVRTILELTRLATRFDTHPAVEAAVKSLR